MDSLQVHLSIKLYHLKKMELEAITLLQVSFN